MYAAKSILRFEILLIILIFQTGCMLNEVKIKSAPCDDLINYYNVPKTVVENNLDTEKLHSLAIEDGSDACLKLRQAVRLSMPDGKQQCDAKALVILTELKDREILSDKDQRFNNMLLRHVSQRQNLLKIFAAREMSLKDIEQENSQLREQIQKIQTQNTVLRNHLNTLQSQLDQLKNIEIEIDKKERSVISPIEE